MAHPCLIGLEVPKLHTQSTAIVYIVNCDLVITIPLLLALLLIGGKRDLELGFYLQTATGNIKHDLTIFGTLCYMLLL